MTNDSILQRYRKILDTQHRAKIDLERAEIEEKLLKLEIELKSVSQSEDVIPATKTEKFIKENIGKLEPDDIEFMRKSSRPAHEVATYLDKSRATVKRWLSEGRIAAGKGDSKGVRMVNTISVVSMLIKEPDEGE